MEKRGLGSDGSPPEDIMDIIYKKSRDNARTPMQVDNLLSINLMTNNERNDNSGIHPQMLGSPGPTSNHGSGSTTITENGTLNSR
jgi:hypothetical protein